MKYKSVIIGCGKIASGNADDPKIQGIYSHVEAYIADNNTELVALCDLDDKILDQCGERWGITNRYNDFSLMITEQKPDIVSICTPDDSHSSIIKEVLNHSCIRAIFAEKPLSLRVDEGKEIVNLAKSRGVIIVVNYSRRYAKNHQSVRESIQFGKLGKIQVIHGYYSKGTFHNGTHWFDLIRYFFGEISHLRGKDNLNENNSDPTLSAEIILECGGTAWLNACNDQVYSLFEMDILGTKGRVKITDFGHTISTYLVSESPYYSGYQSLVLDAIYEGGMENTVLYALEDIVHCLQTGSNPICSGIDGVKAIEIADAVQRSALSGEIVYLNS